MQKLLVSMFVCTFFLAKVTDLSAAPLYSVMNLGGGLPLDINNLGQIVGTSGEVAFRTAPNTPISDPSTVRLGGFGPSSVAYAINDAGEAVGISNTPNGDTDAFRTQPNSVINPLTDNLGTFGDDSATVAYGINGSGQVVGYSFAGQGDQRAFRAVPNNPINPTTDDLGSLSHSPGLHQVIALGINSSGQVLGTSDGAAFLTAPNAAINPLTDGLGIGDPLALNDAGQVVGSFTLDGIQHAFRTAPEAKINPTTDDLGTLGGSYSVATAINNSGVTIGYSGLPGNQGQHAFVYDTQMHDLNDLLDASGVGWVLEDVRGMNDLGQIVGTGKYNGVGTAFLLTPIPVPEPQTMTLSLSGLLALAAYLRNRRETV